MLWDWVLHSHLAEEMQEMRTINLLWNSQMAVYSMKEGPEKNLAGGSKRQQGSLDQFRLWALGTRKRLRGGRWV